MVSKIKSEAELPDEAITFACQECGKSITFPGERGGHVEECPECGSYVDVPRESETPPPGQAHAELPKNAEPAARTTGQLWFEVSAVLCLAYLPWLFGALAPSDVERAPDFSHLDAILFRIMSAARIAMPLLVIIALTKDRWSSFGIVRPRWIADVLLGCLIWFCGRLFTDVVITLLPLSLLRTSHRPRFTDHATPEGAIGCLLAIVAIAASAFVQEFVFRGYLIPRLERLLHSTWLAVLITTVLFGSYHLYQATPSMIIVTADGLVYAVAFCLLRRLWPLCVAHTLCNVVIFFHFLR